jgi:hypothetical protein
LIPPGFPCDGLVGGVFPAAPPGAFLPAAPPPDPPLPAIGGPDGLATAAPPPVDVIVEKIEGEPEFPAPPSGLAPAPDPPAPTVIG